MFLRAGEAAVPHGAVSWSPRGSAVPTPAGPSVFAPPSLRWRVLFRGIPSPNAKTAARSGRRMPTTLRVEEGFSTPCSFRRMKHVSPNVSSARMDHVATPLLILPVSFPHGLYFLERF